MVSWRLRRECLSTGANIPQNGALIEGKKIKVLPKDPTRKAISKTEGRKELSRENLFRHTQDHAIISPSPEEKEAQFQKLVLAKAEELFGAWVKQKEEDARRIAAASVQQNVAPYQANPMYGHGYNMAPGMQYYQPPYPGQCYTPSYGPYYGYGAGVATNGMQSNVQAYQGQEHPHAHGGQGTGTYHQWTANNQHTGPAYVAGNHDAANEKRSGDDDNVETQG